MAQVYFVNLQKGKEEYTSAKRMDASTFKNVFGKPEQLKKHSILPISAEQYKKIKEGKSLKATEIGAVEGAEVQKIASQNELLKSQVEETTSEMANLQKMLSDLQKENEQLKTLKTVTLESTEETQDTEAPAKATKKK